MPWRASHKYARISPSKVRLMVELIRGRDVQDALNILKFTPNRAASLVAQVLASAVANANEAEADVDELHVDDVRVDPGPTIKRFRHKDRGRAHPIHKRTSHITVVVDVEPEAEEE